METQDASQAFGRLLAMVELHREKCPWVRKQTMESLRCVTVEEVFELSEAILEGDAENIKEELGDLLLNVVLYACMAAEKHTFTITGVIQSLCKKLTRRNAHIYGQSGAKDLKTIVKDWESRKLQERQDSSILGGVPRSLPSLVKAACMLKKVNMAGIYLSEQEEACKRARVRLEALCGAKLADGDLFQEEGEGVQEDLGELFFALVEYAVSIGIDPDGSLERINGRFREKIRCLGSGLADGGHNG